jgi:hypothetical protein
MLSYKGFLKEEFLNSLDINNAINQINELVISFLNINPSLNGIDIIERGFIVIIDDTKIKGFNRNDLFIYISNNFFNEEFYYDTYQNEKQKYGKLYMYFKLRGGI